MATETQRSASKTAVAAGSTGTSVSVGVLTAWFVVRLLPGMPDVVTSDMDVYGLLMGLVSGIVAAGARGAGELLEPYLPKVRK